MARIAGVDLPRNKQMWIALTYIYGVGKKTSRDILEAAGIEATLNSILTEREKRSVGERIRSWIGRRLGL